MKLHHIGYVISDSYLEHYKKKFFFIIDPIQKNYIFFNYSKKFNIWFEFLIPYSKKSTVYNFLLKNKNKNKNKIHHYGFLVKNIIKKKSELLNNGLILIGNYNINVPPFGGPIKTKFFYDGKNLIEILSNEK